MDLYEDMTLKDLKEIASDLGIEGVGKYKKKDRKKLIRKIEEEEGIYSPYSSSSRSIRRSIPRYSPSYRQRIGSLSYRMDEEPFPSYHRSIRRSIPHHSINKRSMSDQIPIEEIEMEVEIIADNSLDIDPSGGLYKKIINILNKLGKSASSYLVYLIIKNIIINWADSKDISLGMEDIDSLFQGTSIQ
jgi:hypothetical protein